MYLYTSGRLTVVQGGFEQFVGMVVECCGTWLAPVCDTVEWDSKWMTASQSGLSFLRIPLKGHQKDSVNRISAVRIPTFETYPFQGTLVGFPRCLR